MKNIIKRSTMIVGLFLCLMFTAAESKAQCVGCVPAPPGWMCMGTTMPGGQGCITDGQTCTLIGTCTPILDRNGNTRSSCAVKSLKVPQVEIPDSLISEVGRQDPEFAIVLITIRDIRAEFREGKTNIMPAGYTEADVLNHLNLLRTDPYFNTVKDRIKAALANSETPTSYRFSIATDASTKASVLRVVREGLTNARGSLEIILGSASGGAKDEPATFKAISWQ